MALGTALGKPVPSAPSLANLKIWMVVATSRCIPPVSRAMGTSTLINIWPIKRIDCKDDNIERTGIYHVRRKEMYK